MSKDIKKALEHCVDWDCGFHHKIIGFESFGDKGE